MINNQITISLPTKLLNLLVKLYIQVQWSPVHMKTIGAKFFGCIVLKAVAKPA